MLNKYLSETEKNQELINFDFTVKYVLVKWNYGYQLNSFIVFQYENIGKLETRSDSKHKIASCVLIFLVLYSTVRYVFCDVFNEDK